MNIDARNLIQFSFNRGQINTDHSFDEKRANEDFQKIQGLLRQLDDPYLNGEAYPVDEGAAESTTPDTSRFDRFEVSEEANSRYKEIKLLMGYEIDYTKDKAIDNAWINSQNTMFRLYGNSGRVSDEAVVGMSRGDFAEYMKTHELDKNIDWNAADGLLFDLGNCKYDNFSKYTDHAGALFASLEDRIMTDFSGDEQTEQLDELNKLFDKAVNEVISNTAAFTEYVFDDLGASLPEGKLEASIRQVMTDKKNAYSTYIADNSDYAGINDGEDKWLRRDIGYMANALRNAFTPAETSSTEDTWNENDILVIGMMSTMHSGEVGEMGRTPSIFGFNDEESLGLTLSNMWLREQKLLSTYEPGDDIKGATDELFGKYAERVINRADLAVAVTGKGTVGTNASQFAPIDRDAVFAVIDAARKTYEETGDEKAALVKTAEFARDTFLEKAKTSNLWRYNNNYGTNAKKYWESFYDQKTTKTYYDPSGAKTMLAKWLRFEETVGSKDLFFKRNGFGAVPSSEYTHKKRSLSERKQAVMI